MGKTTAKAVLGVAVLYVLSAMPALAADLILNVDTASKTVTVTNTLATKVTLLFVKGADNKNLSLYTQIDKQGTATVPLHHAMPDAIEYAVCNVDNQRRFLTVKVQ